MPTTLADRHQPLSLPTVTLASIECLRPDPRNARTHSKHQLLQIAASIETFGFTTPVLLNSENTIIAGHGRVAAAKLLGLSQVPAICLSDLTPDQIRAYVIADNKLAQNAGWDPSILAIEFQHLLTLDSLNLTITGFEVGEIDVVIQSELEQNGAEEVSEEITGPPVTRSGDLWQLGKHRVLCGNSLEESSFERLMGQRRAEVVFVDPPYNVRIDGHATGNGEIHHREFEMAAGEMSEGEFIRFLKTSLGLLARYSSGGSVHYVCQDWKHMRELLAAGLEVYDELLNLCVWAKDNGGMGSFYRSQHELVFVFKSGKSKHRNNVQLGKFGRNRTNLWSYPNIKTMSKQSDEGNLLALHPTVKPIAMVADALLDCSARGDIVLDSFLGSGTTLLAAERVGRICYAMELDPLYVDTAVRRWQRLTGENAINVARGKTFNEIEVERG